MKIFVNSIEVFCIFRHRERRQSMKEERKERKIKKKQTKKISRFPKKPEMLVRTEGLEKRKVSFFLF